jgi:hypothetical protein
MVYVYIRRTTDWGRDDIVLSQLHPDFKRKVDVWNATFTIPYFAFRQRIKQIAQQNLASVEGVTCVTDWDSIPDSALVAPIDDDDWFAPELGSVLEHALAPGIVGYYWASHFIEIPINWGHKLGVIRRIIFRNSPQKWLCTTNNYAILKSPESKRLCQLHTLASKWFQHHPERVQRLDKCLSVMNRTLASKTSLGFTKPSVSGKYLIRKFRKYKTLYAKPRPMEPAWSIEYRRMMSELMDDLKLRSQ